MVWSKGSRKVRSATGTDGCSATGRAKEATRILGELSLLAVLCAISLGWSGSECGLRVPLYANGTSVAAELRFGGNKAMWAVPGQRSLVWLAHATVSPDGRSFYAYALTDLIVTFASDECADGRPWSVPAFPDNGRSGDPLTFFCKPLAAVNPDLARRLNRPLLAVTTDAYEHLVLFESNGAFVGVWHPLRLGDPPALLTVGPGSVPMETIIQAINTSCSHS